MIKIAAYNVSEDACRLALELKALGASMVLLARNEIFDERCNIEVYVPDDYYHQVLDLMLELSSKLIVKEVKEDFDDGELNYYMTMLKLKRHYGRDSKL